MSLKGVVAGLRAVCRLCGISIAGLWAAVCGVPKEWTAVVGLCVTVGDPLYTH